MKDKFILLNLVNSNKYLLQQKKKTFKLSMFDNNWIRLELSFFFKLFWQIKCQHNGLDYGIKSIVNLL